MRGAGAANGARVSKQLLDLGARGGELIKVL